ncbi:MAG: hypothetical protein SF052_22935 [Bacteroidia bacterium]|nr:hypothetical protein [Bacteroidia bacterium]
MKRSVILTFLGCILYTYGFGTDYFFQAVEDHLYENPANWLPAYPGTKIKVGDQVLLMEDVNFVGFDIEVKGVVEVGLGVTVISGENGFVIAETGTLDNAGEVLVKDIKNYGRVHNRIAARIHLFTFHAFKGAFTHNSKSAYFITLSDLENQGRFDNYGTCKAGNDFRNHAIFHQIKYSNLDVRGTIFLAPGSVFTHSPETVAVPGKPKRFLIPEKLSEKF